MKAEHTLRILIALALLAGVAGWFYSQNTAPTRARDAVIRDAVLDELKAPSTATFVSLRVLDTMFRAEIDAENSFGATRRTVFLGDYQQTCEDVTARRCWSAKVTGAL